MATANLLNEKQIKEILISSGFVDPNDIKKGEKNAKAQRINLKDYLLNKGIITNDILGQALAGYYKVSYADLNSIIPARELILKIPEKIAKKYNLIAFKETQKEIIVTTDNPKQNNIIDELKKNQY